MNPVQVVVAGEDRELPSQVEGVPEERMVKELAPYRSDRSLNEGMRCRYARHGLDFFYFKDAQVRLPSVGLKERVVVRADSPGLGWPATEALSMWQSIRASTGPL